MHSASVPEPIWGYTDVLHPGLDTGEITKEELPREFLAGAQKVRNSLRGFSLLRMKNLFQFSFASVHRSVVLVVKNLPSKRRHWLNMSRNDLVKIFKFLLSQKQ